MKSTQKYVPLLYIAVLSFAALETHAQWEVNDNMCSQNNIPKFTDFDWKVNHIFSLSLSYHILLHSA